MLLAHRAAQATALFLVIACTAFSCLAQNFTRFEVGSQTTTCIGCDAGRLAIGPEATFNFNQHFALDASTVFSFPESRLLSDVHGGHSIEFLAGPKASIRSPRLALFAKARPGFVRWSNVLTGLSEDNFPDSPITLLYGSRTQFATNFAGGFEYVITPRVRLTAELGDTVLHLTHLGGFSNYTNTVQASSGISYRLGDLRYVHRELRPSHKFLDRTNVLLLSAGLLAQLADGVTTQRNQANCRRFNATTAPFPLDCAQVEANPLARPFVAQGWAGQITLIGLVTSGEVLLMRTIHRMGYHNIERIVPIPLAIGNAHAAYDNLQDHR